MSDDPTHFRNETIQLVSKSLCMPQHFSEPYTPWSNGAVERLEKKVLRVAHAFLSELLFPKTQWPDLLLIFQSVLNKSPSPQRRNICPITACTGLTLIPPISTFLSSHSAKPAAASEAIMERTMDVNTLQQRVEALHLIVETSLKTNRERSRLTAKWGELTNFTIGNFVLVARDDFQ